MKRKRKAVVPFVLILLTLACAPMNTSINVRLSLDTYHPRLDASRYSEYKGLPLIFYSIDVEAQNVRNMYFTSGDGEIGYVLFYAPDSMQQPVASFFWYALDKAFRSVGVDVREGGPIKNVPQMLVKIITITDQKVTFQVNLSRNGYLLMQKHLACSKVLPPTTTDVPELRRRMFAMIDLMAVTILSDPDVKREFFSEKGKI